MSNVLPSAGEPGTARCSDAESGSTLLSERFGLALDAGHEMQFLAISLQKHLVEESSDLTYALRGLALRLETLGVIVVSALDEQTGGEPADIAQMLYGNRLQAQPLHLRGAQA